MTPEIVILAMIAAFLGLRLYSVLGRRAEHEEEPIAGRFEGQQGQPGASRPHAHKRPETKPEEAAPRALPEQRLREMPVSSPAAERGLAAIASADRRFDAFAFLEGARGAYRLVLESFWKGDKAELRALCDADVYDSFASAIDARLAAGETLDNRLVRIDDLKIVSAGLDAGTARITVRFVSDIAAITRNAQGEVVAGSLDDAIEAVDVWTFARSLRSSDPDWVLEETDAG
ncbi:Tim44/TimA family putative adaptor protein [Novosphingobium sp. 1949]|uniref:Tim44/TimA family putative adaptor protein n=1 Tax=Novosphingobium organovorum TaxID=2930092 RepID=A0ABT0BCN9_9SPHN|nr:Tim44/TimA family putative adaptor protein [Novosphingobium organovorum]MCJ2182832.1 Tim44/TimA family putative adaptor protein [Novosphingobium organovorum]